MTAGVPSANPMVADGGATAVVRCGAFRLGPMALALPMQALREVVPLQGLTELPCGCPSVIGAIDLRGVLLPVLDLHRIFGTQPLAQAVPTIVIVVQGGRLLGLLADGVSGVFSVAEGSHKEMGPQGEQAVAGEGAGVALLAASVRRADTGALVSLLSPDALARLPDVPWVEDPEPARQAQVAEADPSAGDIAAARQLMLLRTGRVAWGIDAMAVHATLQVERVERSVLAQGDCRGVVRYADQDVPAVDLLAFCGLARADERPERTQAFLMQLAEGLVALLVDEVVDVVRSEASAVIAVPAFAVPRPQLLSGTVPLGALAGDHEAMAARLAPQLLVLNAQAMARDETLRGLAQAAVHRDAAATATRTRVVGAPQANAEAPVGRPRRHMITFDLFGEAAVPIEQVAEILAYQPQTAIFDGQGPTLGLVVERGRSIPVLCLRRLAGGESLPASPTTSVLVVRAGGHWVGFAVPQLRAIELADWEPALPPHAVGAEDGLGQALQSHRLARVGQGAQQRMLRVLDLEGAAQALLAAPVGGATVADSTLPLAA